MSSNGVCPKCGVSSNGICVKCETSSHVICSKCGYHGYENIYESASSYAGYSIAHTHYTTAPWFRIPKCRPPSQSPFHSCEVQNSNWPRMRRAEKTFLIVFSTMFLSENIVQWSFYNLPELGKPLKEQFEKNPLALIHTLFGTIILLTYLFFWMFGIYSILLKRPRILLAFVIFLFFDSVISVGHVLFHVFTDRYWQGMVLVSIDVFSFTTTFFLVKAHYRQMRLCQKCY